MKYNTIYSSVFVDYIIYSIINVVVIYAYIRVYAHFNLIVYVRIFLSYRPVAVIRGRGAINRSSPPWDSIFLNSVYLCPNIHRLASWFNYIAVQLYFTVPPGPFEHHV